MEAARIGRFQKEEGRRSDRGKRGFLYEKSSSEVRGKIAGSQAIAAKTTQNLKSIGSGGEASSHKKNSLHAP